MAKFIWPLLLYASILAKLRMQALAAAAEEERMRARLAAELQDRAEVERLAEEERERMLRALRKAGLGALIKTMIG
jgi:hypothetical protein